MEDGGPLLSIGELARRAGLPVRTIRFWSDAGVLPPAARTGGGRRLHDAECVARLELVVTLRELGLGLPDVRRVLDGQVSIAEVAAVHLEALDAQIRALRLHRAVLAVVVKRAAGTVPATAVPGRCTRRRSALPRPRDHPRGHRNHIKRRFDNYSDRQVPRRMRPRSHYEFNLVSASLTQFVLLYGQPTQRTDNKSAD